MWRHSKGQNGVEAKENVKRARARKGAREKAGTIMVKVESLLGKVLINGVVTTNMKHGVGRILRNRTTMITMVTTLVMSL